jgi:hypothetical protein
MSVTFFRPPYHRAYNISVDSRVDNRSASISDLTADKFFSERVTKVNLQELNPFLSAQRTSAFIPFLLLLKGFLSPPRFDRMEVLLALIFNGETSFRNPYVELETIEPIGTVMANDLVVGKNPLYDLSENGFAGPLFTDFMVPELRPNDIFGIIGDFSRDRSNLLFDFPLSWV